MVLGAGFPKMALNKPTVVTDKGETQRSSNKLRPADYAVGVRSRISTVRFTYMKRLNECAFHLRATFWPGFKMHTQWPLFAVSQEPCHVWGRYPQGTEYVCSVRTMSCICCLSLLLLTYSGERLGTWQPWGAPFLGMSSNQLYINPETILEVDGRGRATPSLAFHLAARMTLIA